jgi:hypothetical protein
VRWSAYSVVLQGRVSYAHIHVIMADASVVSVNPLVSMAVEAIGPVIDHGGLDVSRSRQCRLGDSLRSDLDRGCFLQEESYRATEEEP